MDSSNLIKAVRTVLANDAVIRTALGSGSATTALNTQLFHKDGLYSRKSTQEYVYPHIAFKLDTDSPAIRGADDNAVMLFADIVNMPNKADFISNCYKCMDRLKTLLVDKPNVLNNIALTFSPAVVLRVRDVSWVSGTTYDDKEQGSERKHRIICMLKMVVGD